MSENKSTKKIHKIVIDRKACIGAATCVVTAPHAFELDEESIAVTLPNVEKQEDNLLLLAAQSCPTQAIKLYDENGNQVFPRN